MHNGFWIEANVVSSVTVSPGKSASKAVVEPNPSTTWLNQTGLPLLKPPELVNLNTSPLCGSHPGGRLDEEKRCHLSHAVLGSGLIVAALGEANGPAMDLP